jgi:hypothetical protein
MSNTNNYLRPIRVRGLKGENERHHIYCGHDIARQFVKKKNAPRFGGGHFFLSFLGYLVAPLTPNQPSTHYAFCILGLRLQESKKLRSFQMVLRSLALLHFSTRMLKSPVD